MHIALYQPDIAGNLGAVIRSCACFDAGLDVIGPCGFPLSTKSLRRAAMDYAPPGGVCKHDSWQDFLDGHAGGRIVLLTTRGATPLPKFDFRPDDTLLFGSEGAGVPEAVHARADARIVIPIAAGARSLNLSNAVAVTLYAARGAA